MTAAELLWEQTGPVADWDEAVGSPMLKWLAGPGAILDAVDTLCRDTAAGDPGWSLLLDITRCPTEALPWLAQFVGVRVAASLSDAQMRAAIQGEAGFGRGTVAALKAAAAPYVKVGGTVHVLERDTSPYHLTVQIAATDLIGMTYGELAALYPTYADVDAAFATYDDFTLSTIALERSLQLAKPAGLVLAVVLT